MDGRVLPVSAEEATESTDDIDQGVLVGQESQPQVGWPTPVKRAAVDKGDMLSVEKIEHELLIVHDGMHVGVEAGENV